MEESKAKASTIAKNKYNAKAYDSLRIVVKKGIQCWIAEVLRIFNIERKTGNTLLIVFVGRAIDEAMERDKGE